MNRPLFSVGEVVILQSRSCPEVNGEYSVERVIANGETYNDRNSGKRLTAGFKHGHYGYVLSTGTLDKDGNDDVWSEAALRKKHDGSEFSFTQLMSVLNSPVDTPQHVES